MLRPDDPLAPPGPVFAEPWQAEALAIADALVRAGTVTADAWAAALGAELLAADTRGEPDTEATYDRSVVAALETLSAERGLVSAGERTARRAAWEDAYQRTPHGAPVVLGNAVEEADP